MPWQSAIDEAGRQIDRVTAAPARHGPAGIEPLAGDVIGFMLSVSDGDARRSTSPATRSGMTALPKSRAASGRASWCCLPARRRRAGRFISPWTPTTPSRPRTRFPTPSIVPVHYDGWAHFKQSGDDSRTRSRRSASGFALRLLQPGVATAVAPLPSRARRPGWQTSRSASAIGVVPGHRAGRSRRGIGDICSKPGLDHSRSRSCRRDHRAVGEQLDIDGVGAGRGVGRDRNGGAEDSWRKERDGSHGFWI